MKPNDIFEIINTLILENHQPPDNEQIPHKILNRLYYLYKENAVFETQRKENRNNIKNQIKIVLLKYTQCILRDLFRSRDETLIGDKRNTLFLQQLYTNYFFDYDTITLPQLINALNRNSEIVEKIFLNQISVIDIIKGITVCMYFEQYKSSSIEIPNELADRYLCGNYFTTFPIKKIENRLRYYKINTKFIDIFFHNLEETFEKRIVYLTSEPTEEKFCLGLKTEDRIFINRSRFPLDELWDYVYHHKEMHGYKDVYTEEFCFDYLSDFFNIIGDGFVMINVFRSLYTEQKEEQDIVVLYENYVLVFECKSHNLREPFRDSSRGINRLEKDFKDSIQEAYLQGKRIRKYLMGSKENESMNLYNSNKQNRKIILNLSEIKPENVIIIAVTLDNYLNLATNVNVFLNSEDDILPLAINLFTLHIILDTCMFEGYQKNNNRVFAVKIAKDIFLSYCLKRTKFSSNVQSFNSEEIDLFGAFISKNKDILFMKDPFDENDEYSVNFLGHSFSDNVLKHIHSYEQEVLKRYVEYEDDILSDSCFPMYR